MTRQIRDAVTRLRNEGDRTAAAFGPTATIQPWQTLGDPIRAVPAHSSAGV